MISFIIPTKNEEKVLEKILLCLSAYKDEKEIIVSDGKSTDNTVAIAKKYTAKVVEHKSPIRPTIASGRNDGAKIAQGDLLLFLDADVYIPEINSFLEKAENFFKLDKNLTGLTVKIRVFKDQETFLDLVVLSIRDFFHLIFNNYFKIGISAGEFQMIRNSAFIKTGGYNSDLATGEDYELFGRLAKIGKTFFVNNLTVYDTGRREHTLGWPRLLIEWGLNTLSVIFGNKSHSSKEWKVIR